MSNTSDSDSSSSGSGDEGAPPNGDWSEDDIAKNASIEADADKDGISRLVFNLVTVHGLYGAESTFHSDCQKLAESATESRAIHHEYNSKAVFSKKGFRNEAMKLLRNIARRRTSPREAESSPIVFISHDVGGSLVKQALYLACTGPEYYDIAYSTRILVFLGHPHRSPSRKDMEDRISLLVFSDPTVAPLENITTSIEILASNVLESNDLFLDTKMFRHAEIVNVTSKHSDPRKQIFDKYSSTIEPVWAWNFETSNSHGDIPKGALDLTAAFETSKKLYAADSSERRSRQLMRDTVVYSSPPVMPITIPYQEPDLLDWLIKTDSYTAWYSSSSSAILTLSLPPISVNLRDHLVRHLRRSKPLYDVVTAFTFNAKDARFNSLSSFLNSTIADLICHYNKRLEYSFGHFEYDIYEYFGTYNDMDAMQLLLKMHAYEKEGATLFILENDNECAEMASVFWEQVRHIMETRERPWKFLVLRNHDEPFQGWLSEHPNILITGHDLTAMTAAAAEVCLRSNWPVPLDDDTVKSWNDSFKTTSCDLEKAVVILKDPIFRDSVSSWDSEKIFEHIRTQSNRELEDILHGLIKRVPLGQRPYICELMNCMLIARRPLTRAELQDIAVRLPEKPSSLCGDVFEAIDSHLPGLFDFTHGEARLQHREIRALCFSARFKIYGLGELMAEQTMATVCRDFLRTSGKVSHRKASTYRPLICNPRDSLADYAAQYTYDHWRVSFPSDLSHRKWSFISRELLTLAFNSLPMQPRKLKVEAHMTIKLDALRAALSKGFKELVEDALEAFDLEDEAAARAVGRTVVYAQSEELAIYLLSHVKTSCADYQWDPCIITRAAFLGHSKLLGFLLQNGAPVNVGEHLPLRRGLLHLAARNNHPATVRLLLENGQDVNEKDKTGKSASHLAAYYGHPQIITALCQAGADKYDMATVRPIYCAVFNGNFAALDALLNAGAEPDYGDKNSEGQIWAPLPLAAYLGNQKCVARLLKDGRANLSYPSPAGTALFAAARKGDLEVSRMLLEKGADPDYARNEETPLVVAAANPGTELVKLLFERSNPSTEITTRALHAAVMNGSNVDTVKFLLQNGADANGRTPSGNGKLIHTAAFGQNIDILNALIEANADLETVNVDGWSPLHISWTNSAFTKRLVEAGVDVNAAHKTKSVTSLHLIANSDKAEVTKGTEKWEAACAILESGRADLDLKTSAEYYLPGCSPLAIAVWRDNADLARLLLEAGADVNSRTAMKFQAVAMQLSVDEDVVRAMLEFAPDLELQTEDGDTVLKVLVTWTDVTIGVIRRLLNRGANPDTPNRWGQTPLSKALGKPDTDMTRLLMKRGANPHHISKTWGTPLHAASWTGTLEAFKLILETAGYNNYASQYSGNVPHAACSRDAEEESVTLEILDHMYNTVPLEQLKLNQVAGRFGYPLGAACYCGTKKVIDWLLERGASTGTADATQRYPLHFAAYRDKFIFQQLCDHGADLGVRDHMGRTVLHVAVQSSSPDLVKYIVSKAKYLRKARDKDNWTPLHYALRGCSRGWNSTVPDKQQEIVELLLSEDACDDSDFKIYNHEKETWSLLKFARYHGANRRTCDTLEAILEKRAGEQWPSQRSEHRTKLANRHGPVSCDYCFMFVRGFRFKCKDCYDFDYCYKCYAWKEDLHPGHEWETIGPEFSEDDPEGQDSDDEEQNDKKVADDEESDAETNSTSSSESVDDS